MTRQPKIPKAPSKGEASLALQLNALGIPFEREVRFAEGRRWRLDFAIIDTLTYKGGKTFYAPGSKIGIEVEGGAFSGGRHSRGKGFTEDCRKYSEAAIRGWTVLRFTTEMVTSGEAIAYIERMLAA